MGNFLLEIDIYLGDIWVAKCPQEMLDKAREIYPESAGFRYGERRQQPRNEPPQQEQQA